MAYNNKDKYPQTVKKVINREGKDIIKDPTRFYAFLNDYQAFSDCAVGIKDIVRTLCLNNEFLPLLVYSKKTIKKTELRKFYRGWAKKYNYDKDKVKYATYGVIYSLNITIDYEKQSVNVPSPSKSVPSPNPKNNAVSHYRKITLSTNTWKFLFVVFDIFFSILLVYCIGMSIFYLIFEQWMKASALILILVIGCTMYFRTILPLFINKADIPALPVKKKKKI